MTETTQRRNPYPGLRPFDSDEAARFFSRSNKLSSIVIVVRKM